MASARAARAAERVAAGWGGDDSADEDDVYGGGGFGGAGDDDDEDAGGDLSAELAEAAAEAAGLGAGAAGHGGGGGADREAVLAAAAGRAAPVGGAAGGSGGGGGDGDDDNDDDPPEDIDPAEIAETARLLRVGGPVADAKAAAEVFHRAVKHLGDGESERIADYVRQFNRRELACLRIGMVRGGGRCLWRFLSVDVCRHECACPLLFLTSHRSSLSPSAPRSHAEAKPHRPRPGPVDRDRRAL